MKPTKPMTLTDRLQAARRAATAAKIALRHAKNEAADFLTWFTSGTDYDALGKNAKARELAFAELLAKDERGHKYESAVREAENESDLAQCALDCVLDEVKEGRDRTWAILADWASTRTASGQTGSRERAGQEIVKEQVETSLTDALTEYHEQYGGEMPSQDVPPPETDEYSIPF